jgi:hypothetical protein
MMRALGVMVCMVAAGVLGLATRPADAMREARAQFADALSAEQRAKAAFAYERRRAARLALRAARSARDRARRLESAATRARAVAPADRLSAEGAHKVDDVLVLESILRGLEDNPGRDPGRFYVTLFGDLAGSGPFGWRFEGHHVSLNFSATSSGIATTPHFLGSNPAHVRGGAHDGLRVLALEEDLGHELVRSLDPKQRALAVLSGAPPGDVILGPGRAEMFEKTEGVRASELTAEQRASLWKLLDVYVDRFESTLAEEQRARLRSIAPEDLRFAWIGSLEPGQPHYYRIQVRASPSSTTTAAKAPITCTRCGATSTATSATRCASTTSASTASEARALQAAARRAKAEAPATRGALRAKKADAAPSRSDSEVEEFLRELSIR